MEYYAYIRDMAYGVTARISHWSTRKGKEFCIGRVGLGEDLPSYKMNSAYFIGNAI